MDDFYHAEDLVKILGLARETIYRKVKSGEIPAVRIGGSLRFPASLLEEWLEEKKGGSSDRWRHHLNRFVQRLRENWGDRLKCAVLFGSFARRSEKRGSDIDLLLVAEGLPKSRLDRQAVVFDLAKKISAAFAHKLSPIVLAPAEAREPKPLYLGVLEAHEILYDPEGFFQGRLSEVRDFLKRENAERRSDPGSVPFWVFPFPSRAG